MATKMSVKKNFVSDITTYSPQMPLEIHEFGKVNMTILI